MGGVRDGGKREGLPALNACTSQQSVLLAVIVDVSRKYVGGIFGAINMVGSFGGFLFSVSFGYFVKWFGSNDLASIPVAVMLTIATLAWLRIDAAEELIPETTPRLIPETAAFAVG